jgi:two-component system cell cycle sensor histidine kinase/response regulator CckA
LNGPRRTDEDVHRPPARSSSDEGKLPSSDAAVGRALLAYVVLAVCLGATALVAIHFEADSAAVAWTTPSIVAVGLVIAFLAFSALRAEARAQRRIERAVDELRRSQIELREADERFREMAEAMDDVFWVIDAATKRLVYVNPAFERVWSAPSQPIEEAARAWAAAIHPDDECRVVKSSRTGELHGAYDEKYRILRPDGEIRWIRDRAFPIADETGAVVRVAGIAQDVTKLMDADEALFQSEARLRQAQKMEAVGRLAVGVAHDFNNLITVIGGYADLSLDDLPADAPARESVQTINEAAQRATALTRQLLAFGRRQVLNPSVVDVNAVVGEMSKLLRRTIGEDIDLDLALAPDLGKARVDASQLEQVVVNLVVNARDAMPRGGRIVVETSNADLDAAYVQKHPGLTAGRYVLFAVTDTGVGIDEEAMKQIFEPFFTTKPTGRGAGLGLATVFGIVQQSGGHVEVFSHVGRGSTFKVYLPRVDASEATPAPAPPVTEAPRGGDETVLVVEDDEPMRALVRRILQRAGYTVLAASSGADLPHVLGGHAGRLDLVVADLVMPGLSGPEVVEKVVAGGWTPRVLYMSGYTDAAVVRHGMITSGTPYLAKPFSAATLLRKVREVLDAAPQARPPEPAVG